MTNGKILDVTVDLQKKFKITLRARKSYYV